MEELLAAAAAAMKMPERMVQRSAEAKAKAQGVSVEVILAEWAGVAAPAAGDAPSPATVAATEPPAPAVPTAPAAPPATPSAAAPAGGSLLAAAAVAMKMPERMVQRSADAKAKAQGVSVEAILAEWAGGEAPQGAAAIPAATPAAPTTPSAVAPSPASLAVEVIGEAAPAPAPRREATPTPEAVVPVGALPRWLAALFLVVPAFAIVYATFLPNGPNCGDAGRLGVDPVTGVAANCDGSAFGSSTTDYYTVGATVYETAGCSACHGASGAGGGSFPGFTGGALLTTFPEGQCAAQVEWVNLGTNGWPDPTYGANRKPVGGSGAVMPAWASVLTADQIRAVVVYERVAFGDEDLATALTDCAPSPEASAAAEGG
ncbi:MAG: c-type cytochrome [Actinomycetota bacterium]